MLLRFDWLTEQYPETKKLITILVPFRYLHTGIPNIRPRENRILFTRASLAFANYGAVVVETAEKSWQLPVCHAPLTRDYFLEPKRGRHENFHGKPRPAERNTLFHPQPFSPPRLSRVPRKPRDSLGTVRTRWKLRGKIPTQPFVGKFGRLQKTTWLRSCSLAFPGKLRRKMPTSPQRNIRRSPAWFKI